MKVRFILGLIIILLSFSLSSEAMNMANMGKKPKADISPKKQIWTCAMHPQIRMNKPGKCPICSMDLIPLDNADSNNNSSNAVVTLSKRARKLAEVQTSIVKKEAVFAEILLTGTLDYDETQAAVIVSQFPGRIEKLYANYTGMYVAKGTHLAEIFSSEIYLYQREILIAKNAYLKAQKESDPKIKEENLRTYYTTLNRMRVLGLTKEQIMQVMKRGTVSDTLSLYSPIDGVIIKKDIVQGQHFKAGDPLFVISNLKDLWLMLDAYELDLPFIRYGQKVEFETDSLPGKKFTGKIVYIDPMLSRKTRSSNVRVVVDNKNGLLKPGEFVRATVFVQLGEKGVVMAESLKNKWISPMHPQIIKNHPGKCDICGIDLVPAESLGLMRDNDSTTANLPLVIPDSAPLITGKRAVVYVELKPGKYEAKTIVLGPKAGSKYLVYSGLKEGEKVVTRGNFKIDSELQIKSTNSGMMAQFGTAKKGTTEGEKEIKPINMESNQTVLTAIPNFYFDMQRSLSKDDVKDSLKIIKLFSEYLLSLTKEQIKSFDLKSGIKITELVKIINKVKPIDSIFTLRNKFFKLSKVIAPFMKHFKHITGKTVYKYECTMAFKNRSVFWFQDVKNIANPYLGQAMVGCGVLIK